MDTSDKIYFFCLPFGMLFNVDLGTGALSNLFPSFSTVIMMIGVSLLFARGTKSWNGVRGFARLYNFMLVWSMLAACIWTLVWMDRVLVEQPAYTILGDAVLFFYVLCSIYFNYICLTRYVSTESLYPLMTKQSIVLLIVGYLQFGACNGNGACFAIYSVLCNVLSVRPPEYLLHVDKGVTFFGSEPAAASLLCLMLVPFLFSSFLNAKKFRQRIGFGLLFLLMANLMLQSGSSSVIICFILVLCVFAAMRFRIKLKMIYCAVFSLGLAMATLYSLDLVKETTVADHESFEYVFVGKLTDKENMSTAMRVSTIINDMKVFASYPLTGVGNGCQGYWYKENMPLWITASGEVQNNIRGVNGVPNGGGNFFPLYISAFGIIGIFFFMVFLKWYLSCYRRSFLMNDRRMRDLYNVGMIVFILTSWYVTGIRGNETMCFLLALPCVVKTYEREVSIRKS